MELRVADTETEDGNLGSRTRMAGASLWGGNAEASSGGGGEGGRHGTAEGVVTVRGPGGRQSGGTSTAHTHGLAPKLWLPGLRASQQQKQNFVLENLERRRKSQT